MEFVKELDQEQLETEEFSKDTRADIGGGGSRQELILPFYNLTRYSYAFKVPAYSDHIGVDLINSVGSSTGNTIYGSGSGTVLYQGTDGGPAGQYVIIKYPGCKVSTSSYPIDLVARYMHLSRIDVSVGQTITRTTRIGLTGSTGNSTGAHLHIEFDTNTGRKWGANDSKMIDPCRVFHIKKSTPHSQRVHPNADGYKVFDNDINLPVID